MSRNQNRAAAPSMPPNPENSPSQVLPQSPSSSRMEFPVPTEFVVLPSGGDLYPEGHPWHNKLEVEIKHMTAKEEDILSSQNYISSGVVLDKFVQSVLMDPVDPSTVLLVDRTAILIAARTTGYGEEYNTTVTCPACRFENQTSFNIRAAMEIKPAEANLVSSGFHKILFDDYDVDVLIRPLAVADQYHLEKESEMRSKNGLPETNVTALLRAMIHSVNGEASSGTISRFVDSLSAKNSKIIRDSYRIVMPSLTIGQDFTCQRCGHEAGLEVPLNADFFWPR